MQGDIEALIMEKIARHTVKVMTQAPDDTCLLTSDNLGKLIQLARQKAKSIMENEPNRAFTVEFQELETIVSIGGLPKSWVVQAVAGLPSCQTDHIDETSHLLFFPGHAADHERELGLLLARLQRHLSDEPTGQPLTQHVRMRHQHVLRQDQPLNTHVLREEHLARKAQQMERKSQKKIKI